ncbi:MULTISPECIES: hypothetical protein [Inquilinus]|uniref:Uncharacterized protein n=1 Tax=Inquilinus ginsengisoli TaxID=363840 RepID=A0ABU1JLM8_9PROT|nr:hypothetical protein [Inquilinus ginsengisoli]MDR6289524.1 hypothetical protein [Inquilinus ginsengisoli]
MTGMRSRMPVRLAAMAFAIGVAALTAAGPAAAATPAELAQKHLYAGTIAEGDKALTAILAKKPDDAEAIAGLGMIRLARAVEHFSQSLYRFGFQTPQELGMEVPLLAMPVPLNPKPEEIHYEDARAILQTLVDDLALVDQTLEPLGDRPVKFPVAMGRVRLDLAGKGQGSTTLYDVYNAVLLGGQGDRANAGKLTIAFDTGDVLWLRAYTHVLRAGAEFLLARDWHRSFDAAGHILFPRSASPLAAALSQPTQQMFTAEDGKIADGIAWIHLINWPVAEPDRLPRAREHLKAAIGLSREMWASIRAETDNDREWLPNAKQTSLIPGMTITDDRIDTWMALLQESDAVLDGTKLLPHWRFDQGFNLRKLLESPQPFDLVLLLTGTDMVPYLEDGPVSDRSFWDSMDNAFEGQFLSFAVWIN